MGVKVLKIHTFAACLDCLVHERAGTSVDPKDRDYVAAAAELVALGT